MTDRPAVCRPAKSRKVQSFTTGRGFVCFVCNPRPGIIGLIRRSIADPTDVAFYVTFGPHTTELKEFAAVAGLRWAIEECFQSAKGETGLDHCEVRSWRGWHRHMTLSMLALALSRRLRARLPCARGCPARAVALRARLPCARGCPARAVALRARLQRNANQHRL